MTAPEFSPEDIAALVQASHALAERLEREKAERDRKRCEFIRAVRKAILVEYVFR